MPFLVKDGTGSNLTLQSVTDGSGYHAPINQVTVTPDVTITGPVAQSTANVDLLTGNANGWFDAALYQSGSIQIIGTAGITQGQVIFEQTNDTTLAPAGVPLRAYEASSINTNPLVVAVGITASTTRLFTIHTSAQYIRVRISQTFLGGTVQAVAVLSQRPTSYPVVNVQQTTAGNLLTSASVTAIAAGTTLIGDVGQQYRAAATGGAAIVSVLSPATPAATAVKATAGKLIGFNLQNSAASLRSVKFWNTAVGSITLGTTPAIFEVDIPAGGNVPFGPFEGGISFATAISYAVTSAKGLTDNTTTGLAASDVSGVIVYA
jgi:hypothetical protein